MTEHYEQKINIGPTKRQILIKRLSFVFALLTIIFAIPAGLVHLAFLAGTIINIIIAFVCNQFYLGGVAQYIVEINRTRYTVSSTNRFGKTGKIFDEVLDTIKDIQVIQVGDNDILNMDYNQFNKFFDDSNNESREVMNVIKYFDTNNFVSTTELTLIRHNIDNKYLIVILPLDLYAQELMKENVRLRNEK